MKLRKIISLLLASAMAVSAMSITSFAEEAEMNPINALEEPCTEEEIKLSEERIEDANRVSDILFNSSNGVSEEDKQEVLNILSKYSNNEEISFNIDKFVDNNGITTYAEGDGQSVHWWLPLVGQELSYHCGPACGSMVLRAQGKNVSRTQMATDMGTTTDGTPIANVPTALNKYSNYTYVRSMGSMFNNETTWAVNMTNLAILSLIQGRGVIYNTVQEKSNSTRLVGYPSNINSTIYHYVAGEGFDATDASNRICNYVDPNNASYTAYGVYGRHDIAFRVMGTLTYKRGLVH